MPSLQPHGFESRRVEAFILAGGRSRRMGRDKARLEIDGEPLALHLARRIAPHVARLRLVTKRDSGLEDLGLEMLYDAVEDGALVHGMRAALVTPGCEWRWLLACDMPAMDASVLYELWRQAQAMRAPGAAPWLPGRTSPEPLPSLWADAIGAKITPAWGLMARDWVQHASLALWRVPAGQEARFVNTNSAAEWDAYRRAGAPPEA